MQFYIILMFAIELFYFELYSFKHTFCIEAAAPYQKPETSDYIENVRRSHKQIIDNVNLDEVIFANFDSQQKENADLGISSFREFINENRAEIISLYIAYNQKYKDRPIVIPQLKGLYEKLKAKGITIERYRISMSLKSPKG